MGGKAKECMRQMSINKSALNYILFSTTRQENPPLRVKDYDNFTKRLLSASINQCHQLILLLNYVSESQ